MPAAVARNQLKVDDRARAAVCNKIDPTIRDPVFFRLDMHLAVVMGVWEMLKVLFNKGVQAVLAPEAENEIAVPG
jgi:hypothetical protein